MPEGMAMYKVRFQMVGFVEVPAHDEEEAREQALHNAILPGLSHYDVKHAEVTKVEVVRK